jgi:hypothetical protein
MFFQQFVVHIIHYILLSGKQDFQLFAPDEGINVWVVFSALHHRGSKMV